MKAFRRDGARQGQEDGAAAVPRAAAQLPLAQIVPDPDQPRRAPREERLRTLAASVRVHGVLQPVLVRPHPAGPAAEAPYMLVAGERRWRAAQRAGLATVPACLQPDLPRADRLMAQVEGEDVELREQLPLFDLVRAVAAAFAVAGCTVAAFARRYQRPPAWVAQALALAEADGPFREALEEGYLRSSITARAFAQLSPRRQWTLLAEARRGGAVISLARVERSAVSGRRKRGGGEGRGSRLEEEGLVDRAAGEAEAEAAGEAWEACAAGEADPSAEVDEVAALTPGMGGPSVSLARGRDELAAAGGNDGARGDGAGELQEERSARARVDEEWAGGSRTAPRPGLAGGETDHADEKAGQDDGEPDRTTGEPGAAGPAAGRACGETGQAGGEALAPAAGRSREAWSAIASRVRPAIVRRGAGAPEQAQRVQLNLTNDQLETLLILLGIEPADVTQEQIDQVIGCL